MAKIKTKMLKVASSQTIQGLEKIMNHFFHVGDYRITECMSVYNNSTRKTLSNMIIKKEKGKFVFYLNSEIVKHYLC